MAIEYTDVWEHVFSFLSSKDLKNVSLVSKDFKQLSSRSLWKQTKLKGGKKLKDAFPLEFIANLPVKELTINWYVKENSDMKEENSWDATVEGFEGIIDILRKSTSIRVVVFGWSCHLTVGQLSWLLDVPFDVVIALDGDHFLTDESFATMVDSMLPIKRLRAVRAYEPTLSQLQMLLPLPVQKVVLADFYGNEREDIRQFADILGKFDQLKRFKFICDDRLRGDDLIKFQHLPVKLHLEIRSRYHLKRTVEILDTFTQLQDFNIMSPEYEFTVDDLKLISKFPMKELDTTWFVITEDSFEEFVSVVNNMTSLREIHVADVFSDHWKLDWKKCESVKIL